MRDFKAIRRTARLTQSDVAGILGVTRQTVSEAEGGYDGPTRYALRLLWLAWPHLPDDVRAELLARDAAE